MHEMGIAMQIVEIATSAIPDKLADVRVERINLKLGKLSSVVPESLNFCLEVVTRDTPLAGAKIHIEEIPVVAKCRDCGFEWTLSKPIFTCQMCESACVDIIAGRELEITSIEVADQAPDQ